MSRWKQEWRPCGPTDTSRAIDLIRGPRSMAVEIMGDAIETSNEIDTSRSIDLIREPGSMAVESRGRDVVAAGATSHRESRHV